MKIENGAKVCITGAASGIGRATAIAMSGLGARLFLTDINENGLNETCRLISRSSGHVPFHKALDICCFESVKAFADEVHEQQGPLEILINNAGIFTALNVFLGR